MNQINKYYKNGNSLIKVLSIVESDEGSLFICINYNVNFKIFDLRPFNEKEFKVLYEVNEINNGNEFMPIVKAEDLF